VRSGRLFETRPHPADRPGINFTLCWICGYVLIKKKGKTPWIMLAVVIFQWMLSTVHVSLGFTVRIYSFHRRRITNPYFSRYSGWYTDSSTTATNPEVPPPISRTFPYPETSPRSSSIPSTYVLLAQSDVHLVVLPELIFDFVARVQTAVGDGVVVWRWVRQI